MKKLTAVAILATCSLFTCTFAWAEAPEGEGWVSLFNGTSLDGWRYMDETPDEARNVWSVVDGVIDCNPSWMRTVNLKRSLSKTPIPESTIGDLPRLRLTFGAGPSDRAKSTDIATMKSNPLRYARE